MKAQSVHAFNTRKKNKSIGNQNLKKTCNSLNLKKTTDIMKMENANNTY